jgi:hypothetical protein
VEYHNQFRDGTNASQDNYRLNGGVAASPTTILQNAENIGLTCHPTFLEYWTVDGENGGLDSNTQSGTQTMSTAAKHT